MNSVDSLLKVRFNDRPLHEKLLIKSLGRPTPLVEITQKARGQGREYQRRFNASTFIRYPWLCACDIRNALFCFPCLLFGAPDAWSKTGVKDLAHYNDMAKIHTSRNYHINNVLDLVALGNVSIADQLTLGYQTSLQDSKEQAKEGRYILSKIIDCIKVCGELNFPLRQLGDKEKTENSAALLDILDLVGSIDNTMKDYLESASYLEAMTNDCHNELLECILEVCRKLIREELKQTEFVALMIDDTLHVTEHFRIILIFRYEIHGCVHERFWGALDPKGQSSEKIRECILAELKSAGIDSVTKKAVVAHTLNGITLLTSPVSAIQTSLQQLFPLSKYLHSYDHRLSVIMEKVASQNRSARVFFSSISLFVDFFTRSSQLASLFDANSVSRLNSESTFLRNLQDRTVNTIYEKKNELIECLKKIEESFCTQTIREARALRYCLEDPEFVSWLELFRKLTPRIDLLESHLYSINMESDHALLALSSFAREVEDIRDNIGFHRTLNATEVCRLIIAEANNRFRNTNHFSAAQLLESSNFLQYLTFFPLRLFNRTVDRYRMLHKNKLQTELTLLYGRTDFRTSFGLVPLLKFIYENKLDSALVETTALLRIILTTPMKTTEVARMNSSVTRVKDFLKKSTNEDCLSAMAMLTVEKKLVSQCPNFNEMVMEMYFSKGHRELDFLPS